tara:strand:- start:2799 stop:11654 length:8856 start_codon:yes stop_codon:yes gene_type:complete
MGLPTTMRGATTPEQIYEYVMGAYFGGQETSWTVAKARKFIGKMDKMAKTDKEMDVHRDPELHPDWAELPSEIKPLIKKYAAYGIPGTEFKGYGDPAMRRYVSSYLGEEFAPEKVGKEVKQDIEGFETRIEKGTGETTYVPTKETLKKFKAIVMSGGAKGSDQLWGSALTDMGVPVIHYSFKGGQRLGHADAKGLRTHKLTESQLESANTRVAQANQTLGRDLSRLSQGGWNAIRRNWWQIKNASAVYAVGDIVKSTADLTGPAKERSQKLGLIGRTVKGGTGWGVQMARDKGLKINVYDVSSKKWHNFDYKANRFIPIEKPSPPPKEWAAIGTRFYNPKTRSTDIPLHVKEAVLKFVTENYKLKKVQPSKAEAAEIKKAIETKDTRKNYLDHLESEIKNIEGKIAKGSLKESKLSKKDIELLEKERDALEAEYTEKANEGRIYQYDVVTGEILKGEPIEESYSKEDLDIGNRGVGHGPLKFVERYMRDAWDIGEASMNRMKQFEIAEYMQTSKEQYATNTVENKSEQWANDLSKRFEVKLDRESRGRLRQQMARRNLSSQVIVLGLDDKYGLKFLNKEGDSRAPITGAGQKKYLLAPDTAIQIAFAEQGGKGTSLSVLDHITTTDKYGNAIDVSPNRYLNSNLFYKNKKNMAEARREYNNLIGRAMRKADEKDFYLYGGKGDNDRMYFVKFNPRLKNFETLGVTKFNKLLRDNKMLNDYKIAEKEFIANFNVGNIIKTKDYFKKSYLSNLLYDLQMNGFKTENWVDLNASIKEFTSKNNDFITSSKAFNKRSQIWFTDAIPGDNVYTKKNLEKEGLDYNGDGKLNYTIIRDLPESIRNKMDKNHKDYDPLFSSEVLRDSNQLGEHVDGAIVMHDKVVDALLLDAGMPSSGQNKSFIISRGESDVLGQPLGALLGKYMIHKAGPKMSEAMEKANLHMYMQESAVKQRGRRGFGELNIEKNIPKFKGSSYSLNPSDIKYNYSVVNSAEMTHPQRVAKQLLGALLENTKVPVPREVIDDVFNSLVGERFNGSEKYNNLLLDYQAEPSLSKLKNLRKNFNELGITQILDAMKDPNNPEFADMAYREMLRLQRRSFKEDVASGEITKEQYDRSIQELGDFESQAERRINSALRYISTQKDKKSPIAVLLHKEMRDWRMQAFRNYIVREATKPKVLNSGVARIRPYDLAMQHNLDKANKRLLADAKDGANKDSTVFFLDNAYKAQKLKTSIRGMENTTLGEFYEAYEKGHLEFAKKEAEEVLRAVVYRVPMDSISGAHILKFGGFTGRDGHGILLHSKSMRALGGADLDGDEAFFFFGDEAHGMRKSWKDAIHANKEEFYEKVGKRTIVRDNKSAEIPSDIKKELGISDNIKTFRDLLTISGDLTPKQKAHFGSLGAMYSPTERMRISEATVQGRMALGMSAIVPKQMMAAAHAAALKSPAKEEVIPLQWFNEKTGKVEELQIIIEPRSDKRFRDYARGVARAEVAFASDPMDELGMKSHSVWFKQLFDSHFKIKGIFNKKGKEVKYINPADLSASDLQSPLYNSFKDINSAFWGRNWAEGRRYTMSEIQDMAGGAFNLSEPQMGSSLAKTGRLLGPLDWTDSIYRRIDKKKIEDLYTEVNKNVDEFKWLKRQLGRSSFKVPETKLIELALSKELHNPRFREEIANDKDIFKNLLGIEFNKKIGDEIFWKNKVGLKNQDIVEWDKSVTQRMNILEKLNRLSEDFLYNDLTDMITLKNIYEITGDMSKSELANVEKISKKVEDLKNKSWLMGRDTGSDITLSLKDIDSLSRDFILEWAKKSPEKLATLPPELRYALAGERSRKLDQSIIDSQIRKFKNNLSTKEQDLFDHMMLGSLRRGELEAIDALEKGLGKKSSLVPVKNLIRDMRMRASKTSTSRLGYMSREISDKNIDKVTGDLIDMVDAAETTSMTSFKEARKIADKAAEVQKDYVKSKESPLEDPIYEPLEESSTGYESLKKGVQISDLPKDMRSVMSELVANIRTYNNKVGKNINEIIRGFFNKDLNALNLEEFRALNEWFKDIKRGTIWQQIFDKKGLQKLQKRHWYLFPKTINRELMRDNIELMEQEGFYFTKDARRLKGVIKVPTHYIDITQQWIARMNDASTEQTEYYIRDLKERLLFVDSIPDGEILRQIAVRKREHGYANWASKLNPFEKAQYIKAYKDIIKEHSALLSKNYNIKLPGKEVKTYTGSEVVDIISKEYTNIFKEQHRLMTGKVDADGVNLALKEGGFIKGFLDPANKRNPIIDVPKFIRHLTTAWKQGKNPSLDFGIDGLKSVARSMMLDLANRPEYKELRNAIKKSENRTNKIDYNFYWPHMFFNKKKASESFKKAYAKIESTPLKDFHTDIEKAKELKANELKKLIHKHHNVTGEWKIEDINDWNAYSEAIEAIDAKRADAKDKIKWFTSNEGTGSMQTRGSHIEGWSVDSNVPETYIRSTTNAYYRQLSQIFSRNILDRMYKVINESQGKDQADAWNQFMRLYVQDAMGNPTNIPDHYLNNKNLKLQGTAYAWWADNKSAERIDKIKEKLGLMDMTLPSELRKTDLETVRNIANLEAQYQMASLLAHPKSMVTNIFGGSAHTIQSAGWASFKNARSIQWLKKNINNDWNSMSDVSDFVERTGVVPEYMLYESGLKAEFKQAKNKQFIQEVADKLTKNPKMTETTLKDIAQKYKVKDNIMQFAAKFMTVPERAIRRDAFMAHYINAWNKLGGALKDPNHPYIIEMAKKGVKATQFLYSAPFRPAFARSALGKVMTRFQLWSWNAVRFRNDIWREAKMYGLKPGTEAYDKFVRTAQIDIFVFALANAFAYSLFETALPAPWNWFQDTADWIFGDETERDRAFFGQWPKQLAPLQMVTPPVFRLLPSSMRALVDDDWSKVSQYYVWTMFPFGRMARDIAGPGNLIENPIRVLEKTTGFPLLQAQKKITKLKEEDREITTPGTGLV